MSTAKRSLKVEEAGNAYRAQRVPKIRIQGQWLARLGFAPNSRVEVIPGVAGELILKAIQPTQ